MQATRLRSISAAQQVGYLEIASQRGLAAKLASAMQRARTNTHTYAHAHTQHSDAHKRANTHTHTHTHKMQH